MNIQCPDCAKAYKIPDEKVKGQGVKVKCKQCESTFIVRPDGTATLAGASAAPARPVSYALRGPGGAKLGPFPLDTIKARIEVGEITREWQAGPVGQPLRPIAELPELADVEWPAIGADDGFGFAGSAEAPAAPAAGGDEFGFDDFASASSAPAAGGDNFGFDAFSGGEAAAPSPSDAGVDLGFGDALGSSAAASAGDDEFGFGDEAVSSAGASEPTASGDVFGFDDFADAPAPSATATAPTPGGDDFGFDDFADAPAPSATATAPMPGGDDFGFDDFTDAPAPSATATAPAPGGDDFGFDDFGDAPAPSAPAAPAGGDDFGGFDDFVDEPAQAPGAGNALDALFDEPAEGEIDEGAFAFGDEAIASAGGEKVFYEEDFDHAFGDEVVRQVEAAAGTPESEAPAAKDAIYGWQDDTAAVAASAGAVDEELITTLEQLSKTKPKSKTPLLIAAAVPLALAGLVAGLIFGLPGVARNLPGLGPIVLDIHEAMNSEFHRQRVLGELLGQAMPKIESWVPSQVASGVALLETVLRDVPDRLDVVDRLARAKFFLALAGVQPIGPMPQGTPVAAAYAAALAGGELPASVDPASDRMLAVAYLDWRAGRVTEAVAPLTRATGLPMPQQLFTAILRANIESSRGAATTELAAWQTAQEAAPDNPWVSLRTAWSIWRQGNRPAETRAALDEARKQIALFDPAEEASLHELAARVALFEGKYPEALKETQAGLAKLPKNPVLLALKGRAHIEQKQWAEANLVLDDALAVDPRLPEAIVAKAEALIGIDRGEEGLAMLEAAMADQPGVALLAQRLLALLIARNRLAQAEVVYERAAALFPEDSTIVRLGADLALARHDIEVAQKRLDIFRELNPNDMSVIVKLAEISLRRGQLDVAEKRLREIAEGDSRNVQARIKLGEVLLLRGRPDEAEKILLDVRDLASDNPTVYGLLARAYLDRKDPEAALEMLQEGMRLNTSIWSLHLSTGEALFMMGKTNDAIYAFDKAAELSDGAVPVLLWQAKAYAASGRPGKALDFYREVLAKEPENIEALRQLTIGQMQVDQWDAAREVADTWRKVAPDSAEPYLWGGRARLLKGDVDEAIKVLESGVRRGANSAELQSELGWAWLQKKQISKAAAHLGQARKLAPRDGQILLRIGYLYKAQNRVADARKAFEAAMKAAISDEDKARAKTELDTLAY